jgi:hypothetical protein
MMKNGSHHFRHGLLELIWSSREGILLRKTFLLVVLVMTNLAADSAVAQHEHAGQLSEKLGTVHFPISCSMPAQAQFTRGVAMLHSFWFKAAIEQFQATLKADPKCAMAYWGIALSSWENPFSPLPFHSPQTIEQARSAVAKAAELAPGTDREAGYISAVAELWRAPTTAPRTRLQAYTNAMDRVASQNPEDSEAAIFYAVALAASAAPTDKTYANQLRAGAILDKIFLAQPDHPGVAHYIIHSYDVPALASKALNAANRYAEIAPASSHALHMPSHTYTRVGYWQESIDTNRASAAAAKREGCTAEELHAMDYQMYAYLQTGQDRAAKRLLDSMAPVAKRLDPRAICGAAPGSAGLFAAAAIPARYALERGQWAQAAALPPRSSDFAYADAPRYFARALGMARIGNIEGARQEIQSLVVLRDKLMANNDAYWSSQVEIQRQIASAWVRYGEGQPGDALDLMRKAAAAEDATEKAAVTPGPLAPARELLGEMLLASGQPTEALAAFEANMKKEPNRFRSLYGGARAAEAAGNPQKATEYYKKLLDVCLRADNAARPELQAAKKFLAQVPR